MIRLEDPSFCIERGHPLRRVLEEADHLIVSAPQPALRSVLVSAVVIEQHCVPRFVVVRESKRGGRQRVDTSLVPHCCGVVGPVIGELDEHPPHRLVLKHPAVGTVRSVEREAFDLCEVARDGFSVLRLDDELARRGVEG